MPFTRPVAGDPVVVEDFGQPVYDYVTKRNIYGYAAGVPNQLIGTSGSTILNLQNPVTNGMTSAATGFTIVTPGKYLAQVSFVFSGASGGAYVGLNVEVDGSAYGGGVVGNTGFWSNMCFLLPLGNLPAGRFVRLSAGTDMGANVKVDYRSWFLLTWMGD